MSKSQLTLVETVTKRTFAEVRNAEATLGWSDTRLDLAPQVGEDTAISKG